MIRMVRRATTRTTTRATTWTATRGRVAELLAAAALAAATAALAPGGAEAQQRPDAVAGDRVRVTTPTLVHWDVEGELLSLTSRTLLVQPRSGGDAISIPRSAVERLRVSEGPRRATLRGAFIGMIVGFAIGEAIVAADRADGELDDACGEQSCRGWGTRFLFTGIGIGAGGVVGSRFHHERWRDVPLDPGR